jgi:hypothetical protein
MALHLAWLMYNVNKLLDVFRQGLMPQEFYACTYIFHIHPGNTGMLNGAVFTSDINECGKTLKRKTFLNENI